MILKWDDDGVLIPKGEPEGVFRTIQQKGDDKAVLAAISKAWEGAGNPIGKRRAVAVISRQGIGDARRVRAAIERLEDDGKIGDGKRRGCSGWRPISDEEM